MSRSAAGDGHAERSAPRKDGGTGDRQATMKEVARRAGVAVSSVSRALNDHPDVSSAMRTRVLRVVEELGYEPDFVAQSLRTGATRTVGFVMRDISNPLFAEVVKGAERELERHGYSMLLMNSLQDPLLDARHIRLLRQRRVDGLILSLQSETNPDTMTALSETAAPIVLVDREIPGVRTDSIVLDHFAGVHSAVTALLDAGHRRLALIAGPDDIRSSRERRRGFVTAHEDAGIEFDHSLVLLGSYTRDFGFEAASALLTGDRPPTAIVAGGIQLGIGLLAAINDLGLRSARDVSVVVCDDVELMRLMDPPVSVVARDADEMGRVAARLLVERLRDPDAPPRTEVLPTYYVPRGSTATIPA